MPISLLNDDDQITVLDSELVTGGDKDTSYTVRKITLEKQREIRKANTRRGDMRRPEYVNVDKLQDDQIDYALIGWSGVVDRGQPVPCERAFKLRMDPVRRAAILDAAGLQDVVAVEEAKKDSFR